MRGSRYVYLCLGRPTVSQPVNEFVKNFIDLLIKYRVKGRPFRYTYVTLPTLLSQYFFIRGFFIYLPEYLFLTSLIQIKNYIVFGVFMNVHKTFFRLRVSNVIPM